MTHDRTGRGDDMQVQPAGAATRDEPGECGARLARLVAAQRDLCGRIEAMGDRQTVLIGEDDTDGLLGLLGERQSMVDELASLSEQIVPLRAQWEAMAGRLPEAERQAMQRLVQEMARSVERIAARDEADRIALEGRRAAIAEELGGVRRGRGAIAAYMTEPRAGGEARYQDRKG